MHLCPNFDGKNWHITGRVQELLGLRHLPDVEDGRVHVHGLAFDIQGTFTANGAGDGGAPAASVTMSVTDAPHEVDSAHTADAA